MSTGSTKRISEQQRHFARLYAKGIPQKQAAEEAGYRNATVSACQLLDSPQVQEYLDELRAKTESEVVATKIECEAKLTAQINDALLPPREQREAIALLGKMRGWHITKTEHSGSLTIAQPEWSEAEVRARLKSLMAGDEK